MKQDISINSKYLSIFLNISQIGILSFLGSSMKAGVRIAHQIVCISLESSRHHPLRGDQSLFHLSDPKGTLPLELPHDRSCIFLYPGKDSCKYERKNYLTFF